MELHGKNFIGGELSALGKVAFNAVNPASGTTLPPSFFEGTVDEVEQALSLASETFPEYRALPPALRATLLERIADEVSALGDDLIHRAMEESALPEPRLVGERGRTMNQLRMFAALIREGSWVGASIDRAIPDRKPVPKPDLRRMLVPLGPVVVFGASNFPLAFSAAGGDTASALAAGNPVVVKAHPAHPGTSELVATAVQRALAETGIPPGGFSMIHGAGHEVGLELVRHPLTRAVGFTGSLAGGRALFDAARSRPEPIPVYAEMGSINPVFLLAGALRARTEEIASGLLQSMTLGVGQFCTNPGVVVGIEGDGLERFVDRVAELVRDAPPGTMLHEGIRKAYDAGVERLGKTGGTRIVSRAASPGTGSCSASAVVLETDAGSFLERKELRCEVFGPSTLIVRCASAAEMEGVAKGLEGQLTATIHATDDDGPAVRSLLPILREKAGRLIYNGFPTGVDVCPSMQHGGPYPATTDSRSTSVGTAAILRFARPVCYQDWPQDALPEELRDDNPRGIRRLVNGVPEGEGGS